MEFNFNTDRLNISPYLENKEHQDTAFFNQIIRILSPAVTKALPEGWQNIRAIHQAQDWIKKRQEESIVLLIRTSADTSCIGFIFLYPIPLENNLMDLRFGYLLSEVSWGKGLGTEVVRGIVDTCRALGYIKTISGGVEIENIGSIKVLEKCGFHALDQEEGMEHIIFYEKQFLDELKH